MSDATSSNFVDRQSLWILFLSLFIIIFSISLSLLCHKACCFCGRYCRVQCKWPCLKFHYQEYQQERRHLREIRTRHEMELHLATFTQIPGPIPDSYGFRELRRQSAIRDLTSLGFIVVTPGGTTATPPDLNSLEMRNHLTAQQRRDILNRIMSCRTYHVHELDQVHHGMTAENGIDIEEGISSKQQQQQEGNNMEEPENDTIETTPSHRVVAFPLHQEPAEPATTCAICLDTFAEGDIINDTSKCPHVFHSQCLMEWLDKHDVCPCCRCPMITETEWRHAASEATTVNTIVNNTGVIQSTSLDRIQDFESIASSNIAASDRQSSEEEAATDDLANDLEADDFTREHGVDASTTISQSNEETAEPEMIETI